jgi:hypothetical protein
MAEPGTRRGVPEPAEDRDSDDMPLRLEAGLSIISLEASVLLVSWWRVIRWNGDR